MPVDELIGPMKSACDWRTPRPRAKIAPAMSATAVALRCRAVMARLLAVASGGRYSIYLQNASHSAIHVSGGLRARRRGRPLDAAHRARPAARQEHLRQARRLRR